MRAPSGDVKEHGSEGREGVYNVIYSYIEEKLGLAAGHAAIRVVEHLAYGAPLDKPSKSERLVVVPVTGGPERTIAVVGGLESVPEDVRDAAIGMGIDRWTILTTIDLPLALPVFLAGVRIAAVTVIGIATIGAVIDAGGLGGVRPPVLEPGGDEAEDEQPDDEPAPPRQPRRLLLEDLGHRRRAGPSASGRQSPCRFGSRPRRSVSGP